MDQSVSLILANDLLYIAISIAVTVWVGRTLFKNGRVFLVDAFAGNRELADSVNHLLVVGFYLINIGYVSLALKLGPRPGDAVAALEVLCTKIGWVLLVLGGMHFFNLFVFSRMRKRALRTHEPPPVLPTEYLRPRVAQAPAQAQGARP